jgi:preprotein translocase subunit YajC
MVYALIWFAVLGLAFFFFIVRPQRRQLAAHRALVASLHVGDDVITTSGIFGTIRGLDEETIELEIASGVVVKLARAAVSRHVMPEVESGAESGEAP